MHSASSSLPIIYLIEDNPIDIYIVQQLFKLDLPQAKLVIFSSAIDALEELNQMKAVDTIPEFILLDLDMPLVDGWEFLESYEQSPSYVQKPAYVYIFTSSINPNDVTKSQAFPSVAGFISKPLKEEHIAHFKNKLSWQQ